MQDADDAATAPTNRPLFSGTTPIIPSTTAVHENGYRYDSFPGYNTTGVSGRSKVKPGRALGPDLLRGLLMMIMALDHAALVLHSWEHGTGRVPEEDGIVIKEWNFKTAYVVRTLTHLCGPGFTFLLGMGVEYLGRSRTKLGWGSMQLLRYFAARCVVLTLVTVLFGIAMTGGRIWFMNAVLFALAIDYFLAGMLWLAINKTEPFLARLITKHVTKIPQVQDDERDVTQPLLRTRSADPSGARISRVVHNTVLLLLSIVTICWNLWLSDDGGVCKAPMSTLTHIPTNPFLRVWFWPIMSPSPASRIMSGFPPLAWISFAILGILYARIMTGRPWTRSASSLAHVLVAVLFTTIFVLTRVIRIGNLSENCLQTPDQQYAPKNPYLASPASFFYVVKYPPDVAFLALTMAGNMLLLAGFNALPPSKAARLTLLLDFGTSALFFYILHMVLLMALGSGLVALFGRDLDEPDPMNPGRPARGIDSLAVYFAFWAGVMLLLWPCCRAYSRFKSSKGADSLWRFF